MQRGIDGVGWVAWLAALRGGGRRCARAWVYAGVAHVLPGGVVGFAVGELCQVGFVLGLFRFDVGAFFAGQRPAWVPLAGEHFPVAGSDDFGARPRGFACFGVDEQRGVVREAAHEHPDLPQCERGAPSVAVVDVIEATQVGLKIVGAGERAQQRGRGAEHVGR